MVCHRVRIDRQLPSTARWLDAVNEEAYLNLVRPDVLREMYAFFLSVSTPSLGCSHSTQGACPYATREET